MDASLDLLPDLTDILELKYPWELDACSAFIAPEQQAAAPPLPLGSQGAGQTVSDSVGPSQVHSRSCFALCNAAALGTRAQVCVELFQLHGKKGYPVMSDLG